MSDSIVTAFRTYLITERRFALNSVAAYMADTEQLIEFLEEHDIELSEYTKETILEFLSTLHLKKLSMTSIGRKVVSLRLFGAFLAERYKIPNGLLHVQVPKAEQLLPRYLTEDEIQALFHAVEVEALTSPNRGGRNHLMLMLLYSGGLRVSELLALKPLSFRFDTGFVEIVGKRGRQRVVPLPAEVLQLVKAYIAQHKIEGWLFVSSQTGNPLTRQQAWNIVKEVVKKAGIARDISPHSLRHSLATHFLGRGVDLRSLQVFLGHESIETVEVYTHVDRTSLREIYKKTHPRK